MKSVDITLEFHLHYDYSPSASGTHHSLGFQLMATGAQVAAHCLVQVHSISLVFFQAVLLTE